MGHEISRPSFSSACLRERNSLRFRSLALMTVFGGEVVTVLSIILHPEQLLHILVAVSAIKDIKFAHTVKKCRVGYTHAVSHHREEVGDSVEYQLVDPLEKDVENAA